MSKAKSLVYHSIIAEKAEDTSSRNEFIFSVKSRDALRASFSQAWRLCAGGLPLEDRKKRAFSTRARPYSRVREEEPRECWSSFLALRRSDCPQKWRLRKHRLFHLDQQLLPAWRGEKGGGHPLRPPQEGRHWAEQEYGFVVWRGNVKSEGKGFHQHNCS